MSHKSILLLCTCGNSAFKILGDRLNVGSSLDGPEALLDRWGEVSQFTGHTGHINYTTTVANQRQKLLRGIQSTIVVDLECFVDDIAVYERSVHC